MKNIRKLLFSKSKNGIDWKQSCWNFFDEYEDTACVIVIILLCSIGVGIVYLLTLIPKHVWPYILIGLLACAVIGFVWSIIHKFRKVMVRKSDNGEFKRKIV